jgi:hypothetical protein
MFVKSAKAGKKGGCGEWEGEGEKGGRGREEVVSNES